MSDINIDQITIIIADDTAMMRAMHKKYLVEMGFKLNNLTFAENGALGFQAYEKMLKANKKPHLMIVDWDMPEMDGLTLLKKVKGNLKTNNEVLFLMVTGHEKKQDYEKLKAVGLSGLILKPFNADDYKKKIIEILSPKYTSFKLLEEGAAQCQTKKQQKAA